MYIRVATRSDLPNIASVASRAMMEDELSLWLSPNQQEFKPLHRERCLRSTKRRWNSGMTIIVAVTDADDTDWNGFSQIIGYAAYEKEVGVPDDSSKRKATWSGGLERLLSRVEGEYHYYFRNNLGTSRPRNDEINRVLSSTKTFKDIKQYWELDILCVDPAFGRRGIGSTLIDWGQQRASEDNVPLLLWASKTGYPLYLRKGFVVCEMLNFGNVVQAPAMIWRPATVREQTNTATATEPESVHEKEFSSPRVVDESEAAELDAAPSPNPEEESSDPEPESGNTERTTPSSSNDDLDKVRSSTTITQTPEPVYEMETPSDDMGFEI